MREKSLFSLLLVLVSAPLHAQLLQDNTWEIGKSFVGTDKEKFLIPDDPKYDGLRPTSVVTKNTIALVNRGVVVTKNPIPDNKPMTIVFDWSWIEGRETDRYPDSLVVMLRTTGAQRQRWSHEMEDGIAIRFDPTEKQVSVQVHQKGDDFKTQKLAAKDMEFKRFESYAVVISDTDQRISVFVNNQFVVEAKVPEGITGRKVALYNREPVARVRHVSLLTNIELGIGAN